MIFGKKVLAPLALLLVAALLLPALGACGKKDAAPEPFTLDYFSDVNTGKAYDSSVFYRNDLTVFGGDAGVIYVSPEEDAEYGGWFYMYTSGNDGVTLQQYKDGHRACITCLRSKDLNDWELCGAVDNGFSCRIESGEWVLERTWAPEVLRNPENGKYYMYFTAFSYWYEDMEDTGLEDLFPRKTAADAPKNDNFMGAVLVSDKPVGPFRLANSENGRYFGGEPNANGDFVSAKTPQINIYGWFHNHAENGQYLNDEFPIIDPSPFLTSDGKLYLTFCRHKSTNHPVLVRNTNDGKLECTSCLWIMEMHDDWVTPKYETLTKITETNYRTVTRKEGAPCWDEVNGYTMTGYFKENDATWAKFNDGESNGNGEGHINEAPQILERDGRFYLCYSPRGYESRLYDVKQAISDTGITGPYTKLPAEYARVFGANLKKIDAETGMTSTGHHAFVQAGGELFCVYYVHADPYNASTAARDGRVYAVDRIDFIDRGEYGLLLYGNGPTATLQFKPDVTTGLHNVMLDSDVTVNAGAGTGTGYLYDNKLIAQEYFRDLQFSADGATEITIAFDTAKEIRALSVCNAYEYKYAFSRIDSVTFELTEKPDWFPEDKAFSNEITVEDIGFNANYVRTGDFNVYIQTGAAANIAFNAMKVRSVTIRISQKLSSDESNTTIKLSEIRILGR